MFVIRAESFLGLGLGILVLRVVLQSTMTNSYRCECVAFAQNSTAAAGQQWKTCGDLCDDGDPWCRDAAGTGRPATFTGPDNLGAVDGCCRWTYIKWSSSKVSAKCTVATSMYCPFGTMGTGGGGMTKLRHGVCMTEAESTSTLTLLGYIMAGVAALVAFFIAVQCARGYRCVKVGKKWKLKKPDAREFVSAQEAGE